MNIGTHSVRRWPLFLIAAPAAVAVWSGWVGLGGLCGFGLVQPFPGIVPWHLNTAITLPVGVEAYGAYALGAWLTPGTPGQARTFARRSAIGALTLGMVGQVVYHLLAAVHAPRAPWPVVVLVACLPVVTLGFGAALTHLLRIDDGHDDDLGSRLVAGHAELGEALTEARAEIERLNDQTHLNPGPEGRPTLPLTSSLKPADGIAGTLSEPSIEPSGASLDTGHAGPFEAVPPLRLLVPANKEDAAYAAARRAYLLGKPMTPNAVQTKFGVTRTVAKRIVGQVREADGVDVLADPVTDDAAVQPAT